MILRKRAFPSHTIIDITSLEQNFNKEIYRSSLMTLPARTLLSYIYIGRQYQFVKCIALSQLPKPFRLIRLNAMGGFPQNIPTDLIPEKWTIENVSIVG